MAKRKERHVGGHGWFVTFADLMALLVSFFVMLVAMADQNAQKMSAVAGSMRDAFGTQQTVRNAGMIEVNGLPTRSKLKNAAHVPPEESSDTPGPSERDAKDVDARRMKQDIRLSLAASSMRQALQDAPDLMEVSKQVLVVETPDGLNLEIIDQDGRSMFPDGSKEPYERTRHLLEKVAVQLKTAPYRISIVGHTSASKVPQQPDYGPWELTADRANAVRRVLEQQGIPSTSFFGITGKADIQPLFPDDPYAAPNRRVTIALIREEPPIPVDFTP